MLQQYLFLREEKLQNNLSAVIANKEGKELCFRNLCHRFLFHSFPIFKSFWYLRVFAWLIGFTDWCSTGCLAEFSAKECFFCYSFFFNIFLLIITYQDFEKCNGIMEVADLLRDKQVDENLRYCFFIVLFILVLCCLIGHAC